MHPNLVELEVPIIATASLAPFLVHQVRRDRKVACVQHVNTGHNPFVANLLSARTASRGRRGSRGRTMTPLLLDFDLAMGAPGSDIDDGFALALAVADPAIDLRLVTTVNGNTDVGDGDRR